MKPLFLLTFSFQEYWLIPVAGVAVCGLAFLVGRRFLAGRPGKAAGGEDGTFGTAFLKGVTRERRAAPRRRGNSVEVQLSAEDGTTLRGWILDRSLGGLCVLVEQPVAEGAVFKIRPSAAAASVPWTDVTVRSCRRKRYQYELGCQFVSQPNWNELLHFG